MKSKHITAGKALLLLLLFLLTNFYPGITLADDHTKVVLTPDAGHRKVVTALALSSANALAASGSWDGTIKIREAGSGRLLRTLTGSTKNVIGLAFIDNGRQLLSIDSEKGTWIRKWDTETGALIDSKECDISSFFAVFSPDGALIAEPNDNEFIHISEENGRAEGEPITWWIDIIDQETLTTITRIEHLKSRIGALVFSHDGKKIVAGFNDGSITVFNVADGQPIRKFTNHSGSVNTLGISRDGRWLASGGYDRVILWDIASGAKVQWYDAPGDKTVAISPDGSMVAANWNLGVVVWPANGQKELRFWQVNNDNIVKLAFFEDGKRLVMGGMRGGLYMKDIADSNETVDTARVSFPMVKTIISNDERRMAVLDLRGNISLWDMEDGALIETLDTGATTEPLIASGSGETLDIAFSNDSETLVSNSDQESRFWNSADGRLLSSEKSPLTDFDSAKIVSGPDGFITITVRNNYPCKDDALFCGAKVKISNAQTQHTIREFPIEGKIMYVHALSPRGDRAVIKYLQGMKLIDTVSGKQVKTGAKMEYIGGDGYANSAIFTFDGQYLITGHDSGIISVCDSTTGKLLSRTQGAKDSPIIHLALSHDRSRLASFAKNGRLMVLDLKQKNIYILLDTYISSSSVSHLDMTDSGKRLVVTREDGVIELIDIDNPTHNMRFLSNPASDWLSMTIPGFFNASPDGAELLSVVRNFQAFGVEQVFQAMYRPDLVHETLAGDPEGLVATAARHIDLEALVDSGLPPVVSFVKPVQAKVRRSELEVIVKLADQGGGVGKIEWRINGTTIGVDRGIVRAKGVNHINREITLNEGDNLIEVVAYNAANLVASDPKTLRVYRHADTGKRPPDLHVLTVGINNYWDHNLKLNYAVPDANAVAAALKDAGGGLYRNVVIHSALDEDATEKKLDLIFGQIADQINSEDVFLFFLAGHGKTIDGRYFFLPQDFRYRNEDSIVKDGIGQDQWQNWFSQIPARKSLLLYDTCESGSLTGTRKMVRGLERVSALDKLTRATGRTVLSASTDNSPALEGYRGHGVFTYAILEALATADDDKNNLIELTELAGFIDQRVPEISLETFGFRQVPQMRIVGSNFPIAKRLTTSPGSGVEIIPIHPTHVVITTTTVHKSAEGPKANIKKIPAGTQIRVMGTDGNWSLIARNGRKLGFILSSAIVRLQ